MDLNRRKFVASVAMVSVAGCTSSGTNDSSQPTQTQEESTTTAPTTTEQSCTTVTEDVSSKVIDKTHNGTYLNMVEGQSGDQFSGQVEVQSGPDVEVTVTKGQEGEDSVLNKEGSSIPFEFGVEEGVKTTFVIEVKPIMEVNLGEEITTSGDLQYDIDVTRTREETVEEC